MKEARKLTPFGKAVKKRLVDLDMNQCDLAKLLGVTPPQITYILYGDRPADRWREPICNVLGMNSSRRSKKES